MPETRFRESLHNPFPQLKRVAILPFFNQSSEPTVDTVAVAEAYYTALQSIPGFEVLPVGVTKLQWLQYVDQFGEPRSGQDFQQLAEMMGVEAIVVGSVTDFDAYYPPRMALTVHWYAANAGFHPIPAGYGLPWGTDAEDEIPRRIVREAEFELARSQLATQTPLGGPPPTAGEPRPAIDGRSESGRPDPAPSGVEQASGYVDAFESADASSAVSVPTLSGEVVYEELGPPLPPDWPHPTDLIPDPPSPHRPLAVPNHEPVLSHTRLYRGDDPYFTDRLADYVETGDDARAGGWQGYLIRSDDFVRFCCYLHIVEMLESRGGHEQSDLILRWPLSRY